jgi:hypothetical protein
MLLTILLFLFLADVFTRRVLIGWSEVAAGGMIAWKWMVARIVGRGGEDKRTRRLLSIKQSLKESGQTERKASDELLAKLKHVKIERSPLARSKPEPLKPVSPKPQAAEEGPDKKKEEETFTSHLLDVRQKTRARIDKKKRKGDPSP